MRSLPQTNEPLQFIELKQEQAHQYWPFIKPGLEHIKQRIPDADWLPEDIFTAFKNQWTNICLVRRGTRDLGFAVYQRQLRPFSNIPDIFIQAAWFLNLKDRQPGDNIVECIFAGLRYLKTVGMSSYGAKRIIWMSPRKGWERKYGFKPQVHTFWLDI